MMIKTPGNKLYGIETTQMERVKSFPTPRMSKGQWTNLELAKGRSRDICAFVAYHNGCKQRTIANEHELYLLVNPANN